ncbi:ABC transporter ATP-binding protein [Salinicola sp. JS01]|uniref:ATP-binding cassette domain-containing protein n=1 Tax=Salinicola sp. JS01 TaxID=3050071 RepID=UPI00255B926B|nr:ABC transporter ATP-binding protein [Salinicola sp. JS01]WIX32808.1 ABC transporter ATP-binding protein [Salinicola sp. JS01]
MPEPNEPVLRVDNLSVRLGAQRVVDGLDFTVGAGERVCLIGPSGSGKSLTAAAILGITPPTASVEGRIRLGEFDVAGVVAARRPRALRIGMVFQNTQAALNPLVSVGAQLSEPFVRFHGLPRRAARVAAAELLTRMRLTAANELLTRSPAELSGGQRQRVCVALALACKPSLIVADEPTTALDALTQAEVLTLLHETTGGAGKPALLFISHDMGAASRLCQRAVILEQGRMIESGPLADLVASPRQRFTRELVSAMRSAEMAPEMLAAADAWPAGAAVGER